MGSMDMSHLTWFKDAPENVRVVRDGVQIPCELIQALDDHGTPVIKDGCTVWHVVNVPYLPGDLLNWDRMPDGVSVVQTSPRRS